VDRKVKERRRLVSRERGRRRAGLIFLGVIVLAAAALFLWLRASDVFAVEQITAPATRHVTQEQIADAVESARGVSLLKVSTGDVEEALRELPYVRTVHVYRSFPHGLEVRLEEYDPVARLEASDGETWLMAENGRLLEKKSGAEAGSLPLVVTAAEVTAQAGGTVPQTVLAALPVAVMLTGSEAVAGLPAVEQILVAAGGEVTVRLEDGAELRLGVPIDLKHKMTVAIGIIQEYLRDGKALEYVDASAADRVAVKAQ
jgi:cell division septal protein FtsQ